MPQIERNQRLKADVQQRGEQHEKLIALINDLHDALKAGSGKNLPGVFRSTVALVKRHFSDEEKLMQAHGYPEIHDQKQAHELFVSEVNNLFNQFKSGGLMPVSLANFLRRLEHHIQGEDKKYGNYLNSKGA